MLFVPFALLLLVGNSAAELPISEVAINAELIKKLCPIPTLPIETTRTHRVGARRYKQFGTRCWNGESCHDCVCCGECSSKDFVCVAIPGNIDFCLLYEKLTKYTDIEKQEPKINHQLPADFPDLNE